MNDRLEAYNVVWDSPSDGPAGSMPLGNGDIGLNVWMEATGDLVILIAKTDAWDENSINLKLGRIRVKLMPNPVVAGAGFRQTLLLGKAEIEIVAAGVRIRVWVDANQPVVRIEAEGESPFEMQASLEIWRTEPRAVKTQTGDLFKNLIGKNSDPYPTIVWPDQILSGRGNRIAWCHHNEKRDPDGFEINMKLQGLSGFLDRMPHPLAGRTFGAAMEGEGFVKVEEKTLRSAEAARSHRLSIYALTIHPATVEQWEKKLEGKIAAISLIELAEARRNHQRWWDQFWNRSWIYVTSPSREEAEAAFQITQGYVLQRFMNAAAGRGESPIKFNGSLFSVGRGDDPDFRRWGGPGFWFQNQRLVYWPMIAAGDFDLMRPWLAMYLAMLPLQRHRTETYFHHGGAHYPETIMFWGAEVSAHYGWTPFEKRARPEAECAYLTYYWTGALELIVMMCEYFAHTNDEAFARSALIPIAQDVVEFFDLHYPRDPKGKIRFEPGQALETWHEASNPLPEIAGLRYTLERLLALPGDLIAPVHRDRWIRMVSEIPEIPVGEKDGKRVILPAEKFDKLKNVENPELYCVFPYRLFGMSKPDLALARETFAARLHKSHDCWSQDEIQMALLGLTGEVKDWMTRRASAASHSDSRFPAFWNTFHDWVPDMDHGGVLQMALQLMLMQAEGQTIRLLPAWPWEWEAEFKLHAPGNTVVEGSVRNGKVVDLKVSPAGAAGRVILPS